MSASDDETRHAPHGFGFSQARKECRASVFLTTTLFRITPENPALFTEVHLSSQNRKGDVRLGAVVGQDPPILGRLPRHDPRVSPCATRPWRPYPGHYALGVQA